MPEHDATAAPKFTPAPWAWHTSNSWKRLVRSDRGTQMTVLEPFVHWRDQHPDCTVSEEDMALIAAAPDLYKALARLLECQEQSLRGGCMPADFGLAREGARAALALARGETND